MGRAWYTDGKLLHKKNTFTDFIACAPTWRRRAGPRPAGLIAGRLAGGLLMARWPTWPRSLRRDRGARAVRSTR